MPHPSIGIFQNRYPPGNENISHLGKLGKSSVLKYAVHIRGDILIPWRVSINKHLR